MSNLQSSFLLSNILTANKSSKFMEFRFILTTSNKSKILSPQKITKNLNEMINFVYEITNLFNCFRKDIYQIVYQ